MSTARGAPPNVLLLMADQQKATSLGLYGNPDTRTPALDALAARGVWTRHCFVPHPFCFPSRSSLMTGRYPHAHGVRANGHLLAEDERPLAAILRDAGYRTGASGHFHGGKAGGGRGFDFAADLGQGRQREAWAAHNRLGREAPRRVAHMTATLPVAPQEYVDAVITDDALRFLDETPPGAPFFLHVAWMAPHPPYFLPRGWDVGYDPAALTYPVQDPPDARKPPSHRQTAVDMGTWDAPESELRQALAAYYGMVSFVDAQVQRLLDRLHARGDLENTIVVYTADHGDYAGEHGLWGKSCTLYDCLVRVPLIIAGPPELVPQGGALEGMTQTIDILPTLLRLLGHPVPRDAHGLPLDSLWTGAAPGPPSGHPLAGARNGFDIAFAEVGAFHPDMVYDRARGDNVPAGPPASGRQVELSVMARTAEWKLVYTPGRELQELYDLGADPGEMRNRYGDPSLTPVVETLRARLQDWMLAHT
jgi:arylsulfatase A-like enzyme